MERKREDALRPNIGASKRTPFPKDMSFPGLPVENVECTEMSSDSIRGIGECRLRNYLVLNRINVISSLSLS